ncbi:hypothetical protein CCP4SC76_4940001 [Gammaproteobacteria bacterium]
MSGNYIPIHSMLFRKTQDTMRCHFDPSLDLYEDWDFWLQLSGLGDFLYIPEKTAQYRIDHESGFGVHGWEKEDSSTAILKLVEKWHLRWSTGDLHALMEHSREFFVCRERIHALEVENLRLRQMLESLREDLKSSEARSGVLDSAIKALHASSSWRLTSPLRLMSVYLRRAASYRWFSKQRA